MNKHTLGPIEAFERRFPQYVYHSHKGVKSVQWREAAINLAAVNTELLAALKVLRAVDMAICPTMEAVTKARAQADALLAKAGA